MQNYLFLSDSKLIISKLVKYLPNYYQEERYLLRYEYNGNYIYINKFSDNRIRMMRLFKNIAYLKFKFDKIFLLVANLTNDFKLYNNALAHNLVKLQTDVIVFKIKSVESDFYFKEDCKCIEYFCVCCFGCRNNYEQSSDAIYVSICITDNLDYNPNIFINYLSKNKKTISTEIIIRDDDITSNTIPIANAELVAKNAEFDANYKQENINYSIINLEPSAPPLYN